MPVEFDDEAMQQRMQQLANEHLQAVIRDVNAAHSGEPSALVDAHLRRAFAAAGVVPVEPRFSQIVEKIAGGTLSV